MNNKKELILNKGIFFIIVFFFIIVHFSKINTVYSQNSSEKYYRQVIVVNGDEIKGRYPIDETLAKTIHSYRFIYNENNILIKLEILNINCTKPFSVKDVRYNYILQSDWFEIKIEYIDKIEKRSYIDKKGEVYAYEIIEKDELQKNMSQSNYYFDGSMYSKYFMVDKYIWELDDDGKKISEEYLAYNSGIDYESTCKYNNNGYKTEQRFQNEKGQFPTLDLKGYAIIQSDYDEYGNEIERRYYGADSKLKPQMYGFTSIQFDYDKDGNMIEKRYYGINNELKAYEYYSYSGNDYSGGRHAIARFKYDEKGNISEISYYDTNYKLKEVDGGTAIFRYKYDLNCNVIEESYYGADSKLKERGGIKLENFGYAIERYKYDELGNIIERSYFGTDEKLNLISFGDYAIVRYKYDDLGNIIEKSYFGVDGKLRVVSNFDYNDYAIVRYKYDELGHRIEESYFGVDGKLKVVKSYGGYNDCAIVRYKYNELGKEVERNYYDANEILIKR